MEAASVALVQQQENAACGRDAPTALVAAHVRGFGHGHSGLVIVRRCFELASAEQAVAVYGDEHGAGPVAAGPTAAGPAAVLVAVQVAVLPAVLAADQQLLAPQLYLLQTRATAVLE